MVSATDVRVDDVGSILKFRSGFLFGENSAGFCKFVWFPGVDADFPYGVRIVDMGVDCRDLVCRNRFRFSDFLLFVCSGAGERARAGGRGSGLLRTKAGVI